MNERERMLKAVQQYAFAMWDASLFLDSHPEDMKALAYFNKISELHRQAVADFEARYGPLTSMSAAGTERWTWVDSPWPWEMED
ncbi:MAG TPA: spore coat protein CotJB [Terriglobales bacterium]|nr:spore coat protein CotJB [Terriglobales bacterium]